MLRPELGKLKLRERLLDGIFHGFACTDDLAYFGGLSGAACRFRKPLHGLRICDDVSIMSRT
jgi:hypothetical protein